MKQEALPYQNIALASAERVKDLLGRMTLEEKTAQLIGGPFAAEESPDGSFSEAYARKYYAQGICYVGTYHPRRNTRQTVLFLNSVQRFLKEETRLGIPALGVGEGLHGYMAHEATSFPQAIGLASTWDPELVERIFTVVAQEMRARGAHYVLSPVLDLARDPRWGRTEETYGEDPVLAARTGVAAVRGLQGRGTSIDSQHVLATAKHFAAHGQPEGGCNAAPANYSERILREQFFLPFQKVVEEARVVSVMASYNEINGVPSHINPWILKDLLRGEWGFDGFVISDGMGVDDLYRLHFVAKDASDAALQSFSAGVDAELGRCLYHLTEHVRSGRLAEQELDQAVARILSVKFELGLFENPFVNEDAAIEITNSAAHKVLALEAARESIILLKNEGSLLPLDRNQLKSLAVIGPNAAAVRLGGYSGNPGCAVTILEGLRSKVGGQAELLYAQGCKISQSENEIGMWWEDEIIPPDPQEDALLIAEAVDAAKKADVALLVLGDNQQTCREGWATQHLGDRDSLDLPGRQDDLLQAVVETGTPVVLLLIHGRPATINYAAENVPAILDGWYLGQAGGTAFAEVLFGDVNPGGKLPITVPRSVGQIPAYYYQKPSARRGYVYADKSPLFAFGHGLSYTDFSYSDLHLESAKIRAGETLQVSVMVSNTGSRQGDEVVQLYLHDQLASLTRPVLELKDFVRISLESGEQQEVRFTITPEMLSFLGKDMKMILEPGVFDVMVGGSSASLHTASLEVLPERADG